MLAATQHFIELISLGLAQLDTVPYIHLCPPCVRTRQMNHRSEPCLAQQLPRFTPKQGQYLAFIHAYTLVLGRPPGRADIQRFFRVTPPSVHQMLLTLEREALIRRQKGVARSIHVLINPSDLP